MHWNREWSLSSTMISRLKPANSISSNKTLSKSSLNCECNSIHFLNILPCCQGIVLRAWWQIHKTSKSPKSPLFCLYSIPLAGNTLDKKAASLRWESPSFLLIPISFLFPSQTSCTPNNQTIFCFFSCVPVNLYPNRILNKIECMWNENTPPISFHIMTKTNGRQTI